MGTAVVALNVSISKTGARKTGSSRTGRSSCSPSAAPNWWPSPVRHPLCEDKGSLYARFGIPEYWLVNLPERVIEVYRDREPEERARFGWRYRPVERYSAGDIIVPATLPGARMAVADLLP